LDNNIFNLCYWNYCSSYWI